MRLCIDERILGDSTMVRTYLARDGAEVAIDVDGEARGRLSPAVVMHVVRRYARPLDDAIADALAAAPRLELGHGAALALLHWRAPVDAAGRDWLVLLAPGEPPLAALANGIAAALRHLVARLPSR